MMNILYMNKHKYGAPTTGCWFLNTNLLSYLRVILLDRSVEQDASCVHIHS